MRSFIGAAFWVVLTGCSAGDTDPAGETDSEPGDSETVDTDDTSDTQVETTVSYQEDIQPIWTEYCTDCHDDDRAPDLRAVNSYDELLGGESDDLCVGGEHMPHVVPGEPESSFLLYRVTGDWPEAVDEDCEDIMPGNPNGPDVPLNELDPDAVALISTWIAEGALDN